MDYKEIEAARLAIPFLQTREKLGRWHRDLDRGITIQLAGGRRLLVRWMHHQDIPAVYAIECQIFPSPWSVDNFLYDLDRRDSNISVVGLIDGQVVTYSISYVAVDEFHISNFAVAPEFQRMKIGATMLEVTLQIGRDSNCQLAYLEVRRSNLAALALYQKYGFEVVGLRKNYYQNENEDALLMTKRLVEENRDGLV